MTFYKKCLKYLIAMFEKLCSVTYTNSKCSDVWEVFTKQQEKYCGLPNFFLSDKTIPNYDESTFIYNNEDSYYSVWLKNLPNIKYEYFIYLQEDFILYDYVNKSLLEEYLNFLISNKEYSFVRLIKSGNLNNKKISEHLYEIESTNSDIFSMQPSIWRTEDFLEIMMGTKNQIWLENQSYRDYMIEKKMKGVYHYDNENKRGLNHFDSSVYPYIATALVKGKWNLSEYKKELGDILESNNVDINQRGKF